MKVMPGSFYPAGLVFFCLFWREWVDLESRAECFEDVVSLPYVFYRLVSLVCLLGLPF